MKIRTLVVGPFQVNCLLAICEQSHNAVIIDPGDEASRILRILKEEKVTPKHIVFTHGHLDHVMAAAEIKSQTGVPISMHKGDEELYRNIKMQAAAFGLRCDEPAAVDTFLSEDDQIPVGADKAFTIIHTPGHSPGHICLKYTNAKNEALLICGDTVFCQGIGRTDLWGGSFDTLMSSIQTKILSLPPSTRLIPGHGPETTVGYEADQNPWLRQR